VNPEQIAFVVLAIMWASFGAWLIRTRRRRATGEVIRFSWPVRILGSFWFLACFLGSVVLSLVKQGLVAGQIVAALLLYGDSWGSWNPGLMRIALAVVYAIFLIGVAYPQSWMNDRR